MDDAALDHLQEKARIAGSLEQQEAARLLVHNVCRLTRRQCGKVLQVALTENHRAMMEPGEAVGADWCCQDHVQYQVKWYSWGRMRSVSKLRRVCAKQVRVCAKYKRVCASHMRVCAHYPSSGVYAPNKGAYAPSRSVYTLITCE